MKANGFMKKILVLSGALLGTISTLLFFIAIYQGLSDQLKKCRFFHRKKDDYT